MLVVFIRVASKSFKHELERYQLDVLAFQNRHSEVRMVPLMKYILINSKTLEITDKLWIIILSGLWMSRNVQLD